MKKHTVADLIATLQKLPPTADIYLARDAEINSYADVIEVADFEGSGYILIPHNEVVQMY